MALSNEWNTANDIYKLNTPRRNLDVKIYRYNGFEAFVINEDEETYTVEGNGCKCKIWKKESKPRIVKVSSDYVLRKN